MPTSTICGDCAFFQSVKKRTVYSPQQYRCGKHGYQMNTPAFSWTCEDFTTKKNQMNNFETLADAIQQLESVNYQTPDGLHRLCDNSAFVQIAEFSKICRVPISKTGLNLIELLSNLSNNYTVIDGNYVIYKNDLDEFIQNLKA
jgi:hypothetical protein